MFPYRDDNPTLDTPVVTLLIIAVNAAVWILVQGMGQDPALARSVCELGLIPGEFLGRVPPGTSVPLSPGEVCVLGVERHWLAPLTSMFLHGGWLHLIGNMWFLWVFGNNVEDKIGHVRYVLFYLFCGLVASAGQIAVDPGSVIPTLGASGAIAGVLGAYLVMFPGRRVYSLVPILFIFTLMPLPAIVVLGFWFVLQFFSGVTGLAQHVNGGVAYFAHVGGFLAGLVLALLFFPKERNRPARDEGLFP
jgi:membrane associated rhomboid family serine protease